MTWPGESIRLDSAYDVGATDFGLLDDVQFRAGSRALGSGDHWKTWVDTYFFTDHIYLGPTDTGVVWWVVEVLSGSGTVTAAEGVDPDFGDPAFTAGTALGSHALTAGTNVIPSTLSAGDVYDLTQTFDGIPMLDLQGSAGSVVVQQVKLRVWPVGGPVGSWVAQPGFTTTDAQPFVYEQTGYYQGGATAGDRESAWDAASIALIGDSVEPSPPLTMHNRGTDDPIPVQGNGGGPSAQGATALAELIPLTYDASLECFTGTIAVAGVDASTQFPIASGLVEGVDWWRPPTEVYGDSLYYAEQLGTPSTGWTGATLDVTVNDGGSDGLLGLPVIATDLRNDVVPTATVGLPGYSDLTNVAPDFTGTPVSDGGGVVLDPDGFRWIVVTLAFEVMGGSMAWPGAGVDNRETLPVASFAELRTHAVMPAYRVWVADASPLIPLRIRQRGDNLGQGSNRVRAIGSRQNSVRVRGYV